MHVSCFRFSILGDWTALCACSSMNADLTSPFGRSTVQVVMYTPPRVHKRVGGERAHKRSLSNAHDVDKDDKDDREDKISSLQLVIGNSLSFSLSL